MADHIELSAANRRLGVVTFASGYQESNRLSSMKHQAWEVEAHPLPALTNTHASVHLCARGWAPSGSLAGLWAHPHCPRGASFLL